MDRLCRGAVFFLMLSSTISNATKNNVVNNRHSRKLDLGFLETWDFKKAPLSEVKIAIDHLKKQVRARRGWLTTKRFVLDRQAKLEEYKTLLQASVIALEYQIRRLGAKPIKIGELCESASSPFSSSGEVSDASEDDSSL